MMSLILTQPEPPHPTPHNNCDALMGDYARWEGGVWASGWVGSYYDSSVLSLC